ncbi:MAG: zinc-dependent metalloprotease [Planctomycetota bacterium]
MSNVPTPLIRLSSAMNLSITALFAVVLACVLQASSKAAEGDETAKDGFDISHFDANEGFVDFYWDDDKGKVWIRVPEPNVSLLYVSSLATGLGSNPVGLDRGQLASERIVHFRRVGGRVFLVQENWKYRATTENELERRAIRDSFAESILWSGEVKRAGNDIYADITDFLLRDAHDCVGTLASSGQGSYSLDKARSHIYLERMKSFPKNSEFEAALTFKSSKPGSLARRVAADGKSITLRQHHSFVQLPDAGYEPRRWDPRVGCFSLSFSDYGVPIEDSIEQHRIVRHRLQKTNPDAELSPAKEPIVYYVDPGVPEPIRSALVEGASWWNEAFEAAGFQDAFQVKVLPPDADPMDVRYNVIQWVHRATRGWSYGQTVADPRTGEIIKGHVLLGSLRVRQDYLLFEGLGGMSPSIATGDGRASEQLGTCGMGHIPSEAYLSQLDPKRTSTDIALARIRQLSAHEVGHTLGFAHNFAASTFADRASVMDYPSPRVNIVDGELDLSDAYGVGIGEWDKFSVRYAYSEFPQNEKEGLEKLIVEANRKGYLYITDADSRPGGAAHPLANLWDNGTEPVAALNHEMAVRKIALDSFDADSIADGQPLAELEKAFVPVYLHHRYQVDATAKMLGGYEYTYAVKDANSNQSLAIVPIAMERQHAALAALLTTLSADALVIPARIQNLIPPRVGSAASDRERFASQTAPIFDPASAIRAAAEATIGNLLQPERCSRLARQGADARNVGIGTIVRGVHQTLWRGWGSQPAQEWPESLSSLEPYSLLESNRIVERVLVNRLLKLCDDKRASDDARQLAAAEASWLANQYREMIAATPSSNCSVQWSALIADIERHLNRPYKAAEPPPSVEVPPGSPIGQTK